MIVEKLSFNQHIKDLLQRASLRHGIMARLAGSTRGLEAGILRSAHTSLLTSFATYGLTIVGSGSYEKGSCFLGTNLSARHIIGVGRLSRLKVLQMAARPRSMQNCYLQHIAMLVGRALAATQCSFAGRMRHWLKQVYDMREEYHPKWAPLQLPEIRR